MNEFLRNSPLKYVIPGALLTGLLWLSYSILREFLASITWAIIIAYVMWPAYRRLQYKLKNASLSAALFTSIISILIAITLYWLLVMLQQELKLIYPLLLNNLSQPSISLPEAIRNIPWLNSLLQHYIDQINSNDAGLKAQLLDWFRQWLKEFGNFIGSLGKHIIQFIFTLVTLFFCFRDGEQIITQLRRGLAYFLGDYQNTYIATAGHTTRAVVYGLVLAAFGQGLIAGLG
jgi:P-type Ca2+ transporter type 2C